MDSPESNDDPVAHLVQLSRKHSCTHEELKAAYLRFAKQLHPDHGGDAKQFRRLQGEYRTALSRLKPGADLSKGSRDFVLKPVESGTFDRKDLTIAIGVALIGLILAGVNLPPATTVALASCIAAAFILFLIPLVMASAKPPLVALILVVFVPISLAAVVIATQSNLLTRYTEGRLEMADIALASMTLPAMAMLFGSFVGFLFWLSGDRSQF